MANEIGEFLEYANPNTSGITETVIHKLTKGKQEEGNSRRQEEESIPTQEEERGKELYEEPTREVEYDENEVEELPDILDQTFSYDSAEENYIGDTELLEEELPIMDWYDRYSYLGFAALPVDEKSKKPSIPWKDGKELVFDPEFYWEDKNHNIGMRCDNFFVIDLDVKPDNSGVVNLDRAMGDGTVSQLKDSTAWQTTGGGGLQFFFKLQPGIATWLNNSSNILGDDYPGIDCRFDTKGITVLPPSIHPSGGIYRWGVSPEEVKEAPAWFIMKLQAIREAKAAKPTGRVASEASSWREDSKLVFDVESFSEVKEKVFQSVMGEAEARKENSSGFAGARVDSYDGEERLAIYANKAGIIGDWKGAPKSEILLALGIDPRVWLLQFDANDHEFAKAFYYLYGSRLLWVPEIKSWAKLQSDSTWKFFKGNGAVYDEYMKLVDDWTFAWLKAEQIRVKRKTNANGAYEEQGPGRPKKKLSRGQFMLEWLKTLKSSLGTENRIDHLKIYNRRVRYAADWFTETFYRERGQFDQIADYEFPAANGLVNLKTGDVRAYTPNDFITEKSAARFDVSVDTRAFENEIVWWFGGDLDLLGYVQKIAGYAITGNIDVSKLVVLYGEEGRNGKSAFLSLMGNVLGDLYKPTEFTTLTNAQESRRELAKMTAARLIGIREADVRSLNAVIVKTLTGDETVTARPMYGDPFSFERKFKLWVATNDLPTINSLDGGLQRRIMIIPFSQIPEEVVNLGFQAKWKAKSEVVMKWLFEGARKFYEEGIEEPELVREKTMDKLEEMNTAVEFIRRETVFTDDADDRLSRKAIYLAYTSWCRENEIAPGTRNSLYKALRVSYPKSYRKVNVEFAPSGDKRDRGFKFLKLV